MSSMQSSYDIVTNNRKELSGGLVQQEPEAQASTSGKKRRKKLKFSERDQIFKRIQKNTQESKL